MEGTKDTTVYSIDKNIEENNNEKGAERMNSVEKLPKPVYYIESSSDDTVLIGIDVTISHNKVFGVDVPVISWYDTTHERVMVASETKKRNDYFAFKRAEQEGGGFYYFTPMDLAIYNDKVKQHIINGTDFVNEEDLIKFFIGSR